MGCACAVEMYRTGPAISPRHRLLGDRHRDGDAVVVKPVCASGRPTASAKGDSLCQVDTESGRSADPPPGGPGGGVYAAPTPSVNRGRRAVGRALDVPMGCMQVHSRPTQAQCIRSRVIAHIWIYSPSRNRYGSPNSISRACSSDSVTASSALTTRELSLGHAQIGGPLSGRSSFDRRAKPASSVANDPYATCVWPMN